MGIDLPAIIPVNSRHISATALCVFRVPFLPVQPGMQQAPGLTVGSGEAYPVDLTPGAYQCC